MKNISAIGLIVISLTGCYYDNLEELHPNITPCDTSGVVSYATDINPIIQNSCGAQDLACHKTDASTSGYGFGTYDELILSIDNSGIFLETIKHDPSISTSKWMPKNVSSKIDDCSIQKIEAWLNRGRPNN